jgi:hypothetical protein
VDAVRGLRHRLDRAAPDDAAELLVARELEAHAVGLGRHAAVGEQRLRRKPGPQHHAVRRGVARRDPE